MTGKATDPINWCEAREAGLDGPIIARSNGGGPWRWRNFTPEEMACRHCGATYHWPDFMDALQSARNEVGRAFNILSAHRCSLHNARIGGAPRSQHLRLAADIALSGHDPERLYQVLFKAGFTGFGFYQTFIHIDLGPKRQWFGSKQARTLWNNWLD